MIELSLTAAELLLGALAATAALIGALIESRRMRDDATVRERVAVVETRLDHIDALLACDDADAPAEASRDARGRFRPR